MLSLGLIFWSDYLELLFILYLIIGLVYAASRIDLEKSIHREQPDHFLAFFTLIFVYPVHILYRIGRYLS